MLDLNLTATLFRAIDWPTVKRLIFVGDPNQLPPIGKGKVFSDLIEWLNDIDKEAVGLLKINVRQLVNRLSGKGTGILDLASIYLRESNRLENKYENKFEVEEILKKVQEGGEIDKDLKVLFWKDYDELNKVLTETIVSDLETDTGKKFDPLKPQEIWRTALKGNTDILRDGYQQIISPYRGEFFGVEELNFLMQEFLNKSALNWNIDGIGINDKVIQFRNRSKSDPYLGYNATTNQKEKVEVFNGEIGFVKMCPYDTNRMFQVVFSKKPNIWIDFARDIKDYEKAKTKLKKIIELAYAISVHKAQGNEFERVYFILPKNKKSLLSTELLYTGITRAKRHLTILVEEDFSPFLSLRRLEKSHLIAINSSLFSFRPVPDEILNMYEWYEEGRIHQTLSEYMVRSKSEVIIANMLSEREIPFKYEIPLYAPDGTFYLPDFTITWNGEEYYWEHLGLLHNEDYKNHWETKNNGMKNISPENYLQQRNQEN